MSDIIGHQGVLNFFDGVIKNGRLHHAYCLIGPAQVGKRELAETIGARLLGVERDKLATQLDWFVLEQELNEKTGKTKKNIDVDQIRDLRGALSLGSWSGGWKVAVIDGAEKMNLNSANALLKTLEEPTKKTVLFLLVVDEDELPSTILSRCQKLYAHPVAAAEITRYLMSQGAPEGEAEQLAAASLGRPGRAITWWRDPAARFAHHGEVARLAKIMQGSFAERLKAVEELFGDKTDNIAARERWDTVLSLWQAELRHMPPALSTTAWVSIHQAMQLARRLIHDNIHPRLLIEHVLLEIP